MSAYVGEGIGRYQPNDAQRSLFEEWKLFCISYLISFKEGVNVRAVPGGLADSVGEDVPLAKMGLPSISHFLYAMADCIDVRSVDGFKMYVFIRESAISDNQRHIRDMVLEQHKDKSCKSRNGAIRRPTRNQSKYEPAESLLRNISRTYTPNFQMPFRPILQPVNRGYNSYSNSNVGGGLNYNYQGTRNSPYQTNQGHFQGGSAMSFANRPSTSSIQTNRYSARTSMPVRSRYIQGLIDDSNSDDDDGFEFYSGASTFSDAKWNTVATPATEIATKPMGGDKTITETETRQKKPEITTYQPPAMPSEPHKRSNDVTAATATNNYSSATTVPLKQTLPVNSQSLYSNMKISKPAQNALPSLMTSMPLKPGLQPVNMNTHSNSNLQSLQPPAIPTDPNKRSNDVAASTATNNNSSATTVTRKQTLPVSSQSLYSNIKKLSPTFNSLPSLMTAMPVFMSTSVLPEVQSDDDDTDEDEVVLAGTADLPKGNLNKEEPWKETNDAFVEKENLNKEEPQKETNDAFVEKENLNKEEPQKETSNALVEVNLVGKLASAHLTDPGSNLNSHSFEPKEKVEIFKRRAVVRVIVEPLKTYKFPQLLRGGSNAKANLSLMSFLTMNGLCA